MNRVLLVEDEHIYRDTLARALTRDGHRVFEAASARAAVRIGCAEWPEVLVTDWMLRDRHLGVEVARALQIAEPRLQTVVITAFPSQDLREEVERLGACELIEKPFRLDALQDAIGRAVSRQRAGALLRGSGVLDVGVLEADAERGITHANAAAEVLLGRRPLAGAGIGLAELLADASDLLGAACEERWVGVSPRQPGLPRLALRARRQEARGRRLFVACRFSEAGIRSGPPIRLMLDLDGVPQAGWRYSARILVLDPDAAARRYALRQLEQTGSAAVSAEHPELALQLLAADYGIHFVLIDAERPREEIAATARSIRELRPDLKLVGAGARGRTAAEVGVDALVRKPWTLPELSGVLDRLSG